MIKSMKKTCSVLFNINRKYVITLYEQYEKKSELTIVNRNMKFNNASSIIIAIFHVSCHFLWLY